MTKEQIEAIIKDIEHYVYDTDLYDVEKILEKHLKQSKSVEELIEKRNNELDKAEKEKELISYPRVIIWFIQDLQDLLPEDKEEEVEIKLWTKILDDWEIKIVSRLFTAWKENIKSEKESNREQVYVEFEWYWWNMSVDYIRKTFKIVE